MNRVRFKQLGSPLPSQFNSSKLGCNGSVPSSPYIDFFFYLIGYQIVYVEMSLPAITSTGKDLLEPRLAALCNNAGVPEATMDILGDAGLTTLSLMKNTLVDKDDWRNTLKGEPFNLSGADFKTRLEIGKLVGVYEAACASNDVELKAYADRIRQNLPPEVHLQEIVKSKKIFESSEDTELTDVMVPSKGYYERMVLQVEVMFEDVAFTTVTNSAQEDLNVSPNETKMDLTTGFVRCSKTEKTFFVPLPRTAEELRARYKTYAVCWCFMKMKFPSKSQLRTMSTSVIEKYVDWLFGPKVWGAATLDPNQRPKSTPAIGHVIQYDRQIRKRQAELMNAGHDFAAALKAAQKSEELKQIHFLSPVAMDINTEECKRCTAPGVREAFGGPARKEGPAADAPPGGGGVAAKTIKKIKQQAKLEAEREVRKQLGIEAPPGAGLSKNAKKKANKRAKAIGNGQQVLQIQNGGVGDGTTQKGKAKGKGKSDDLFEGKPICYNWNKGKDCTKGAACTFAHVCLICKKPDHTAQNHPAGPG